MRSLTMATLLMAAGTLSCSSPASDPPLQTKPDPIASCPALASSCPAGCVPVGARPLDREKACLLPLQAWGCAAEGLIGLPAIGCSVTPDGTIWVSVDYRLHPLGRPCTSEEYKEIGYSACS